MRSSQPSAADVNWFLFEAKKRGLTPDPRKIKREAILRKVGYVCMAVVGAWMLVGFLFLTVTSMHPFKEWHREQNHLECVKSARNVQVAAWCTQQWGPAGKEK